MTGCQSAIVFLRYGIKFYKHLESAICFIIYNLQTTNLNCIQRMPCSYKTYPSKPTGDEVLEGTDLWLLLLFRHLESHGPGQYRRKPLNDKYVSFWAHYTKSIILPYPGSNNHLTLFWRELSGSNDHLTLSWL